MVDEYMSICLRWVNSKEFTVHDDFIGLYKVDNMQANTIV